ncbi:uncharacterized protein OCT59_025936 [Rhizophagus irregularis]|nr:hypothetical protein RirG_236710 [Rhizophagus irregularis DAOM 197198w]PKY26098.1 cytochrome P450 [Rhizophagus irregularis]GBC12365.1 cytochrome P450 [Rhizophagus irregularis DAOM 181602=DAOM 197198]UZO05592.1 hypothetical protein OCT59_025936 [Rhizophagus irregularis]CAB5109816.1 unnamed protein product [Rhizophagus irregularis]
MFQDITFEQKYKENSDWLNQTMLGFISKRRNEINNNIQSDGKICSNLLDILLTLNTPLDPNYDGSEAPLTYQEVCSTITEVSVGGNKRNFGDDISRQISYEDLENFTYLDAIIKESARVYAVVPLSSHVSTQETPDEFIPERFLNNEIAKNAFIPFGGGENLPRKEYV